MLEIKSTKLWRRARSKPGTILPCFHRLHYDHEKEGFKDREQFLLGLIKYYAERSKKYQQDSEADEKDRTVAHLKPALKMNAHN